jgi:hypothetical protein
MINELAKVGKPWAVCHAAAADQLQHQAHICHTSGRQLHCIDSFSAVQRTESSIDWLTVDTPGTKTSIHGQTSASAGASGMIYIILFQQNVCHGLT